jgi:hypothetical protein
MHIGVIPGGPMPSMNEEKYIYWTTSIQEAKRKQNRAKKDN